jgi:hypothetical protein
MGCNLHDDVLMVFLKADNNPVLADQSISGARKVPHTWSCKAAA